MEYPDFKGKKKIEDIHAVSKSYSHAIFLGFFIALAPLGSFYGYIYGGWVWVFLGICGGFILSLLAMRLGSGFIDGLGEGAGALLFLGRRPNWSQRETFAADIQQVQALMANARYGQALTFLNKVLKKDPEFPQALFLRAQVLWEGFESAGEAKKDLKKLLDITAADNQYHRWAMSLLLKINKFTRGRSFE